jgi:hypothetical protein
MLRNSCTGAPCVTLSCCCAASSMLSTIGIEHGYQRLSRHCYIILCRAQNYTIAPRTAMETPSSTSRQLP